MKIIIKIFQILVGLVFVVSFLGKISSNIAFFSFLTKLHIPAQYFQIIYLITLFLEMVLAFHLLVGLYYKKAIFGSLCLYFIFTVALVYGYYKGITSSCGCFGNMINSDVGLISIIRNLVLIGMLVLLYKNNHLCYSLFKSDKN